MKTSKTVKAILDDMNKTITELQNKALVRDVRGISDRTVSGGLHEISYPGKNESGSIIFYKHITGTKIINALLKGLQYNLCLLYTSWQNVS